MGFSLLLISERKEDLSFVSELAKKIQFTFHAVNTRDQLKAFLVDHPESVIFWDTDHPEAANLKSPKCVAAIAKILKELSNPLKVFAITNKPINQYPYLFDHPVFGHHIYRRYQDPALDIYSFIVNALMLKHPFGLSRFFPEGTKKQQITLTNSKQKNAAVQAVQNVFEKLGIASRLSAQVAQSTDELLLNAIFDAPIDANGKHTRRDTPRTEEFTFFPGEEVWLELMWTEKYVGVCVADGFGSLKKSVVLKILRANYQEQDLTITKGSGIGIQEVVNQGISLLFICKPDFRTEVMIFCPRAGSFKEFREGVRFLSLITA